MKIVRAWAATISGMLLSLGLLSIGSAAHAASLTLNFDATYNTALSGNAGNTSNLTDYSAGLIGGQTIHGSFSYDPSAAPTFSASLSGGRTISDYFPTSLSFSIPSLNFSTAVATITVLDSTQPADLDTFQLVTDVFSAISPTHSVESRTGVFLDGPPTIFNSASLPANFNVADFGDAALIMVQTDSENGTFFGQRILRFDMTAVTASSETPLPAALPLFATGLGALGLLGWRRKRKAAALAAA